MADRELEQARRDAERGGAPERRRLLQALRRAQRPLAEAWAAPWLELSLEGAEPHLDGSLDELAKLDPQRLRRHTPYDGPLVLGSVDGRRLEASRCRDRADGIELRIAWADGGRAAPLARPNSWQAGIRPGVAALAVGRGPMLAVTDEDGWVSFGRFAELADGAPHWRVQGGVAVGFLERDGSVVWLDPFTLRRYEPNGRLLSEVKLPVFAAQAAVDPRGFVAVGERTGGLHLIDAVSGEVRWSVPTSEPLGERYLAGVAIGTSRVAAWAWGLGEWRLADGSLTKAYAGETVHSVERWEDPESTMGLGRDVRSIRRTRQGASYCAAATYQGDVLLTRADGYVAVPRAPGESVPCGFVTLESRDLAVTPWAAWGTERDTGFTAVADVRPSGPNVLICRSDGRLPLTLPCAAGALGGRGRHLFVGLQDGGLRWFDATTGEERHAVRLTR